MNLTKPQKLIYDMEKFAGGAISVICGSMLCCGKREVGTLAAAVNTLYRLNDALRIRISETDGIPEQNVTPYQKKETQVLHFETKAELDAYAQKYATEPICMFGDLCEIKIVLLPEQYGILVKLHHIIGDAWSLSLLANQFNAILNGETPEAYSYADYVTLENEYLQSKRYGKDKAFFLEQFSKCDEVTYLSEKQSKTYTANRKTFVIGKDKTAEILNYAESCETTAFTLFTAALSAYMNRTKMNAEKFYIGTAVLNRTTAKEKQTVGMFINTVPMLMELDNNKTFAENLTAIGDSAFSVFRHQKYNYGDVLSTLRAEHNFGEKLYDVMLSYQNATVEGEIESTWYHCGEQTESLQIHIEDRDVGGIFRVHFDYLTEKFTEHEIDKLFEHITNLLYSAIEDDSKKLYELDILSDDEKQRLLVDFNDTAVDYPKDKCVHQLFEEQVEKTPDKIALVACDKTLTYKELNEEANRIAHSLIAKGVGVGDIVAFALPRKSYLIATMLGILKSGAAYLPIDPDYPQDRIDYMLSDSNAKLFVTEDNITELLSATNTENSNVAMQSNSLCYCIYTSGSTGKPKGTILSHNNVVNFLINTKNNVFQNTVLNECDTFVAVNSVAFDITLQEIHMPLLYGKKVFLNPENDIGNKISLVNNEKCALIITPTKLSFFLNDAIFCKYMNCFSVIMCGAEMFPNNLLSKIQQYSNACVFNGYGPTETTCGTLYSKIIDSNDISIGHPIANTQIYIVDKYMHPTPIGVTGEICIAGDGVGAGYLNRPELTAEKFIDNPFGDGKLYKTGDLAYWREDGNIAYVGRNDFQVKIRGLRIELGEIENAISVVDGIQQSVVVVRKNNEGRQLICAFYTGKETQQQEIRTQIGKKLPKYMLPHIFTHLDAMPLTASGKINRKALPEIDLYNIDSDTEYEAPQTEKETVLVNAIGDILGIEKVGILDNFFDLGGDSLKAIELISQLQRMGYDTETKTIFECETIKELAEKLTHNKEPEEIAEITGDILATAAQMRVYTAQSVNANSTTYNVPYAFKVENLDAEKLQKAVDGLIARHEPLRTHFENKDGKIIQVIEDKVECKVEQINGSLVQRELDFAEQKTEGLSEQTILPSANKSQTPSFTQGGLEDVLSSFIRPFDLGKAPLMRVGYCKNTVMIDMHHIITDGGSMPIILRELNELYMGRTLDNQPIQYKRFAMENPDLAEDEKYWLSVYGDEIPVLEINTDFKRPNKQSFNGSAVYDSIDIDLHKKILQKCKELNITPFHFYMGGFNILP